MEDYPDKTSLDHGIAYLDATYPQWWHKVDLTTLNMYSLEQHLLSQITGKPVYETLEVIHWSYDTLVRHGFEPFNGPRFFTELTAEWVYRIRMIKDQRK